jgi:hypothetical protein
LPKGALAGAFLSLFLAAMGIMYLERDRPIAIFRAQVEKLARGESEELNLPALSSAYRKIGETLHKALDVIVEKSGGKRGVTRANLDEILGPTPENLTSSAFSFGSTGASDDGAAAAQAMKAPLPSPHALPAPMPAPQAMPAPHAMPLAPKVPPPPARGAVPPPPASASNSAGNGSDGGEEGHYREVFSEYLATRQQCGESTQDLTFDKFCVTLRKNRDQILQSRSDARGVRFSVYVKEGKAALKASPTKA